MSSPMQSIRVQPALKRPSNAEIVAEAPRIKRKKASADATQPTKATLPSEAQQRHTLSEPSEHEPIEIDATGDGTIALARTRARHRPRKPRKQASQASAARKQASSKPHRASHTV
jgi:hypothetical protein